MCNADKLSTQQPGIPETTSTDLPCGCGGECGKGGKMKKVKSYGMFLVFVIVATFIGCCAANKLCSKTT